VLEIGMLGSMWRGLETGSSEHRASPRPYRLDLPNTSPVLDPARFHHVTASDHPSPTPWQAKFIAATRRLVAPVSLPKAHPSKDYSRDQD
jgi:hypothetical protein